MEANVNDVIRHIKDSALSEGELVDDPELNKLLDPFRTVYPIAYKCQKERCATTLAYWAVHSTGARIAPGPDRVYRKGDTAGVVQAAPETRPGRPQLEETSIVGGVADLRFPELDWKQRFEEPVEWAMSGKGLISLETNPDVGSPWPLRWRFTCPRCGSAYIHTNSQTIRMFLHTLYARRTVIRPGTIR